MGNFARKILSRRQKGSVSIEASIILPVFLMMILTLLSIGDAYIIKFKANSAITKSALDISKKYFIASLVSDNGYYEIQNTERVIARNKSMSYLHEEGIINNSTSTSELKNVLVFRKLLPSEILTWKEKYNDIDNRELSESELIVDTFYKDEVEEIGEWVFNKRILQNLSDEVFKEKSYGAFIGDKTQTSPENIINVSESEFFRQDDGIKFVVRYPIIIKTPIGITISRDIRTTIDLKAWVSNETIEDLKNRKEESIWDLNPLKYGKIISDLETKILVEKYPKDVVFDVRSINIYAKSYESMSYFRSSIMSSVKKLIEDAQDDEKGGYEKVLRIVVPEGKMDSNYYNSLEECKSKAKELDSLLTIELIEKYGMPSLN